MEQMTRGLQLESGAITSGDSAHWYRHVRMTYH
jgi:hypothetical protein